MHLCRLVVGLGFVILTTLMLTSCGQDNVAPIDNPLNSSSLEFVRIQAGSFNMGSPEHESGAASDEHPIHSVTLTNPFDLQITELTNQQFMETAQWAFDRMPQLLTVIDGAIHDALDESSRKLLDLADSNCELAFDSDTQLFSHRDAGHGINPDHPVKEVTWFGAAAFWDWLNIREGLPLSYDHSSWLCNGNNPYDAIGYRLPTEAEWEYACRAGSQTPFNTGYCLDASIEANYNGSAPYTGCPAGDYVGWTIPTGSLSANAWGLYEMHGNLLEWCNDRYSDDYYATSPEHNPSGPTNLAY